MSEIDRLENRLNQLTMMNNESLTRSEVDNIVNEIYNIRLKLIEIAEDGDVRRQSVKKCQ